MGMFSSRILSLLSATVSIMSSLSVAVFAFVAASIVMSCAGMPAMDPELKKMQAQIEAKMCSATAPQITAAEACSPKGVTL